MPSIHAVPNVARFHTVASSSSVGVGAAVPIVGVFARADRTTELVHDRWLCGLCRGETRGQEEERRGNYRKERQPFLARQARSRKRIQLFAGHGRSIVVFVKPWW